MNDITEAELITGMSVHDWTVTGIAVAILLVWVFLVQRKTLRDIRLGTDYNTDRILRRVADSRFSALWVALWTLAFYVAGYLHLDIVGVVFALLGFLV